jgi:hypothetical protein
MLIGFGITFVFIFILFDILGISEYVWPILVPILTTTFGIVFFIFVIIAIVSSQGCNKPSDQEMVQRASYQKYTSYDSITIGAAYVIPVYCPQCMNKLELDKVEWIGSSELTCPSCFSVVQASVREEF